MDASGADDETDFRPFFDMVIGILFVLLILVAAQIYFQQLQDQTIAVEAAKSEAALRRTNIAAFLDMLANRLRAGGLAAIADVDAGAVLLPLRDVLAVDTAGLPSVEAKPAELLGGVLAELSTCVTEPRGAGPICARFGALDLDALSVMVGVRTVPPGVALSRDRFGDLGAALLSATLMSRNPALIGASNGEGGRVLTFGTMPPGPDGAGQSETRIGGNLVLDFTFRLSS